MKKYSYLSISFFTLIFGLNTICRAQNSKIDSTVKAIMTENHIAGLSAAVIDSGKIIWTGYYGYQNIEQQQKVNAQTTFVIASTSKTVTAAALMQLYSKGKFKMDDDINKYLPFKVKNPNYPNLPVTFAQLLRHRSAIQDNIDYLGPFWLVKKGDPTIPLGTFLKDYLAIGGKNYNADKNFFKEKPDSAFHYSNIGISLVGYLVERISGMPFEQYCKQNIFTPLEMNTAAWHLKDLDTTKLAMPYNYSDSLKKFVPLGFGGFPDYPAGTLHTTPTQLANFLISWTQNGKFKDKQVFERNAVQLLTPDETSLGYYTWFLRGTEKGELIYNHTGGDEGVLSFIAFNPKTKKGILFMMNSFFESREVFIKLVNLFYYNTH
ncbi:serine hydrolase domain-containing protein [Pedobacter jeongneungensis]|uniref:serine hydrolase domain-containing protein n=1 Tax=Pedobacter jeongneungensis TaxID=947309 RepID=UPI00068CCAFB|nr:serine hydrolase domain-containing protein [Pedobacter jeongneungensis]